MLEAAIVAPLGPLSAEALTFTLVKPPDGACTITCVAMVSPRPLYTLMDVVVPGASVGPTLTKRGDTQTGNVDPVAWPAVIRIARTTRTAAADGRPLTRRNVLRATCSVLL